MLELLYLDIGKGYAISNFSVTGSGRGLLRTEVENGENYLDQLVLDFPMSKFIIKNSNCEGGLFNNTAMHFKSLRVLA